MQVEADGGRWRVGAVCRGVQPWLESKGDCVRKSQDSNRTMGNREKFTGSIKKWISWAKVKDQSEALD